MKHPTFTNLYQYDIIGFTLECSYFDNTEYSLTNTFRKNNTIRVLKFLEPTQIEIEKGFPEPTGGFQILDITERQMENINIEVSDFESSYGVVNFYARDVIEVK